MIVYAIVDDALSPDFPLGRRTLDPEAEREVSQLRVGVAVEPPAHEPTPLCLGERTALHEEQTRPAHESQPPG